MKMIKKCDSILFDNTGETIAEVVVAFAVLAIMLVMFAQGIAYASNTGFAADRQRSNADQTLIKLQDILASTDAQSPVPVMGGNAESPIIIYRQVYEISVDEEDENSDTYRYVVYTAD